MKLGEILWTGQQNQAVSGVDGDGIVGGYGRTGTEHGFVGQGGFESVVDDHGKGVDSPRPVGVAQPLVPAQQRRGEMLAQERGRPRRGTVGKGQDRETQPGRARFLAERPR